MPVAEARMHAVKLNESLPAQPTFPPSYKIPAAPLGFAPPGANAVGGRIRLLSLDFLDETHLLFTFRVPGLLRRDAVDEPTRQNRAVLVELPSGRVVSEALWQLDGRLRSIWPIGSGNFLLRQGNQLLKGDSHLNLKPFLRFGGKIEWLEMAPDQSLLAVENQPAKGGESIENHLLRLDTGAVVAASNLDKVARMPITANGLLHTENLRGIDWALGLEELSGRGFHFGQLTSECEPGFLPLANRLTVVTGCTHQGADQLMAIGLNGRLFWQVEGSDQELWPALATSANGSRILRQSIFLKRPVLRSPQIDMSEIQGEMLEVLDAADGRLVFSLAGTPVLDGYGNAALSPSGNRLAVLHDGNLELYELPRATELPASALE